mgnify:CR=1 FL=1
MKYTKLQLWKIHGVNWFGKNFIWIPALGYKIKLYRGFWRALLAFIKHEKNTLSLY